MDRQTKINEFITALEELSSGIVSKSIEVSSPYLDNLEESIINYIDTNYPSIMFSKDELKDLIDKVYQKKHYTLKKTIDSNIGLLKYKMEEATADINKIITDEISKYKTLFTSISAGTNVSYLGLVDECTQNIMATLIRKNNSLGFAKRTGKVNDYIYHLVNESFLRIMVALGDNFIDKGILPIEEDFKQLSGKSKVKIEEFF